MRQVVLLFACVIFTFCGNKKKIVSDEYDCKVVSMPTDELKQQYTNFIMDCDFCKNQFADFTKIKNGILFYKWTEGTGNSDFLLIDLDKNFHASIKSKSYNKLINFTLADQKRLQFIFEALEKGDYYQNCLDNHGHSTLYLLIVKRDDEIKIQYYSPFTFPYKIKNSDVNFDLTQKIFEIIDRSFYR